MLRKYKFTPENYPLIKDYLPPTAAQLISVIGLEKTLFVLNEYAGINLPFTNGLRNNKHSRELKAQLCEIIGKEAAEKLITSVFRFHESNTYNIPVCRRAREYLRNLEIVKDYDELITVMPDTKAVTALQRKYYMAARSVRYILKSQSAPFVKQ